MTMLADIEKCDKDHPCDICGQANKWCTWSVDGKWAFCMKNSEGSMKTYPDHPAGMMHLHLLRDEKRPEGHRRPPRRLHVGTPAPKPSKKPTDLIDFPGLAKNCVDRMDVDLYRAFCSSLGLSPCNLDHFSVGYATPNTLKEADPDYSGGPCWTFPQRDFTGEIIGIRLRPRGNGGKFCVKGGCGDGLFLPTKFDETKPLYIVEGATDASAMLDMGYQAIGRPNNTSGGPRIANLVLMTWKAKEIIIIHDRDKPGSKAEQATMNGLKTLINHIRTPRRKIKYAQPPMGYKDIRQWRQDGATCDDVDEIVDQGTSIRTSSLRMAVTAGNYGSATLQ